MTKHTIDAQGKRLGRVASEAASVLMGKNDPQFQRHILSGNEVHIENVSLLAIEPKKMRQKEYIRYSGYPSGLKRERAEKLAARKGKGELIRKAVYGMLPTNRLRARMMKNLFISE